MVLHKKKATGAGGSLNGKISAVLSYTLNIFFDVVFGGWKYRGDI